MLSDAWLRDEREGVLSAFDTLTDGVCCERVGEAARREDPGVRELSSNEKTPSGAISGEGSGLRMLSAGEAMYAGRDDSSEARAGERLASMEARVADEDV